jgi:hypothetical protein
MLVFSCYSFKFFKDCFRLDNSVECAFYNVAFTKQIVTLTFNCNVRYFAKNLAVKYKMCEKVRT